MLGNTLEEASDILCSFSFIPESWGTFKLVKHKKILTEIMNDLDNPDIEVQKAARKRYGELVKKDKKFFGKRAVIENIEPSENYLNRRAGTIADILLPTASTFTNKINTDNTLIDKSKLVTPVSVIKFTKDPKGWFTIWNSNLIAKYNGEKKPVIAMRPYLDELFTVELQKQIITMFDTRSFTYRNLITFKEFQSNLEQLKPRQ